MKRNMKSRLIASVAFISLAGMNHALAQSSPLANTSREAITFSQVLKDEAALTLGAPSASAESRGYYERVGSADLVRGVDIITDAPGAVVRLTPIRGAGNAGAPGKSGAAPGRLKADDLEISAEGGKAKSLRESGAIVADQAELAASNPELFEETLAFRVSPGLGKGKFKVRAKKAPDTDYMIHVFDAGSDNALEVASDRNTYLAGDAISASAKLSNGALKRGASVSAALIGPRGERSDLAVSLSADSAVVTGDAPEAIGVAPGELWRVALSYREKGNGKSETPLWRDAELPLALGARTASLRGNSAKSRKLTLDLNVAEAGRYEARALLYARNGAGELQPAMRVAHAEWLDAGARKMTFAPDLDALRAEGFKAPFEIRELQLVDQSRLIVLETDTSAALPKFAD